MSAEQKDVLPLPVQIGDGLTPADIWQSLNAGERRFVAQAAGKSRHAFDDQADGSDRDLMRMLSALPARRWADLCNGVGWTALGASALSWCEDGSIEDVLHVYRVLELQPTPGDVIERAAAMINPELLPDNRLSMLIEHGGGDLIGLCVLIAARKQAPVLDIAPERAADLHPAIAALIDVRGAAAR